MEKSKVKFTHKPDDKDSRDYPFNPQPELLKKLPESVDLRQKKGAFPPIFDQGKLDSCTANVISANLYYDMVKEGLPRIFTPSRLFIYYSERDIEGTIGATGFEGRGAPVKMRDCIKSVAKDGYCSEKIWPYKPKQLDTKPSSDAYKMASHNRSYIYRSIKQDLNYLMACLAEGYPFAFGLRLYESYHYDNVTKTGNIPLPDDMESRLGGHALTAVGYDSKKKLFIIRNSFGTKWGDQGYGTLPFEYFNSKGNTWDYWVVKEVTQKRDETNEKKALEPFLSTTTQSSKRALYPNDTLITKMGLNNEEIKMLSKDAKDLKKSDLLTLRNIAKIHRKAGEERIMKDFDTQTGLKLKTSDIDSIAHAFDHFQDRINTGGHQLSGDACCCCTCCPCCSCTASVVINP